MKPSAASIFIIVAAFLAGSVPQGRCVTPEFIDSLRVELKERNMPENFILLPCALSDQRLSDDRRGIWSLSTLDAVRWKGRNETAVAGDSTDIRDDAAKSTEIALDRLQELFEEYSDWDKAVVAFAQSPTALAAMDSSAFASAPVLTSLKKMEEEYSGDIVSAFGRIETLAAAREAERQTFLREQAALRKARLDSLRKQQALNTAKITYVIRRGDTLGGIAAKYRVKVSDLKKWNGLKSDMIREGRKLLIYR